MLIPRNKNGRRIRPLGEIFIKFHYLSKLRANKIRVIYKLLIFHGFSDQPAFLAQFSSIFSPELGPNQGLWGQNCSATKKISAIGCA